MWVQVVLVVSAGEATATEGLATFAVQGRACDSFLLGANVSQQEAVSYCCSANKDLEYAWYVSP